MKPIHCCERMVWHRIFAAEFNSSQFNFLQKNQNNVATETSVVVASGMIWFRYGVFTRWLACRFHLMSGFFVQIVTRIV